MQQNKRHIIFVHINYFKCCNSLSSIEINIVTIAVNLKNRIVHNHNSSYRGRGEERSDHRLFVLVASPSYLIIEGLKVSFILYVYYIVVVQ